MLSIFTRCAGVWQQLLSFDDWKNFVNKALREVRGVAACVCLERRKAERDT